MLDAANPSIPRNRLLTETEAADFLAIAKSTLRKWRSTASKCSQPTPRFVRVGRTVRYRAADLEAFIETNSVTSA